MFEKRRGAIIDHHMATSWYLAGLVSVDIDIPCDPPSLIEFRTRFPELEEVSDEHVNLAIVDASCWADGSWISNGCPNCKIAIAFLAAHFIAMQLQQASTIPDIVDDGTEGGQVIAGGQVTSLHFENMSVGFSAPKWSGSSTGSVVGSGFEMGLTATYYGQRYLDLLKVNQPAIMVV